MWLSIYIYIYVCVCVYPVRVGAHMTCSTFILIYKAGGEHHHRIASSSLLYYTTFVFILLPRPGWIHYRFPMGPQGGSSSATGDNGMTGRDFWACFIIRYISIILTSKHYHRIVIILSISEISAHICWSIGQAHLVLITKVIIAQASKR